MSAGEVPPLSVADLVEAAKHPKMVGIGESGATSTTRPTWPSPRRDLLRIHIRAAQGPGCR